MHLLNALDRGSVSGAVPWRLPCLRVYKQSLTRLQLHLDQKNSPQEQQ